jgi:hypothetical protein
MNTSAIHSFSCLKCKAHALQLREAAEPDLNPVEGEGTCRQRGSSCRTQFGGFTKMPIVAYRLIQVTQWPRKLRGWAGARSFPILQYCHWGLPNVVIAWPEAAMIREAS